MSEIDIRSGLSEEERLRLERIDRIDENKKRKKLIMVCVTTILILFFVAGTFFGAVHILSYEGTQALPEEAPSYEAVPDSEEKIIELFNSHIENNINNKSGKTDVSVSVNIPDESISITGENAENLKALVNLIKPSAVSLLSSQYEEERYSGKYGEAFSDKLFTAVIDTEKVEITAEAQEDNENNLILSFVFDEKLLSDAEEKEIRDIFSLNEENIKNNIAEVFSDSVDVGESTFTYTGAVMTALEDRSTEKLINIEQTRSCDVVLPLTFKGEYEGFGEITLFFTVEIKKAFSFSEIEFFFKDDVYYIEKGSTDEFKTKVISDQSPAEIEIIFTSSDPSVLSVDGSFYKGEAVSDKPVVVTGTYTYKGITCEDSCEFYVRVPVEGVKVSVKELSLKKGESFSQNAVISPDNATLGKVYWFSSDENIAVVDENGVITAKNNGVTDIYCITLDGNYKSSCTVTINE